MPRSRRLTDEQLWAKNKRAVAKAARASDPFLDMEEEKISGGGNKKLRYFPTIPIHIVHALVTANAHPALPLVLAAHRWMCMRQRKAIPLTRAIWQAAGVPKSDDYRRRAMFSRLSKAPQVFGIIERRSMVARYWLKYGSLWGMKEHPHIFIEGEDGDMLDSIRRQKGGAGKAHTTEK